MTEPRHVDCMCGHPYEGHQPHCVLNCGCRTYRPNTATAARVAQRPLNPAEPPRASVEQLIAQGRRLPSTERLANRIVADLDRLRSRVVEALAADRARQAKEQDRRDALAEVERLKTALSAARARARGERTPPSQKSTVAAIGTFPCPDCDRTFPTGQGVGPHRAKAHGYRKTG